MSTKDNAEQTNSKELLALNFLDPRVKQKEIFVDWTELTAFIICDKIEKDHLAVSLVMGGARGGYYAEWCNIHMMPNYHLDLVNCG